MIFMASNKMGTIPIICFGPIQKIYLILILNRHDLPHGKQNETISQSAMVVLSQVLLFVEAIC